MLTTADQLSSLTAAHPTLTPAAHSHVCSPIAPHTMDQFSTLTQQQLEKLSHFPANVCTSLLITAFHSLTPFPGSRDHGLDIKQTSGVPDADVAGAFVKALTELIAHSVRQNLTVDQFIESLQSFKVMIENEVQAGQMFAETKTSLLPLISLTSCSNSAVPRFRNMDWRIEMEVHRKNLRNVYTPVVLMRFCSEDTDGKQGSEKSDFVRMRISDVHHMRQVMEEALMEANSHRIERQVRKWI